MSSVYDNITILDFTNNVAGPYATGMLGDFGANIIKVERPVRGDDTRGFAPQIDGSGFVYWWYNRGKKSITVDMNDPRGLDLLKQMIPKVDVIVESFRPGVMKKFGLDYESAQALNPNVVYCSVSAYGQTGPNAKKPGYDLIAQAKAGIMDYNGFPDMPPCQTSFVLGDLLGGVYGAYAIAQALYYREKTGEGQYLDLSLVDALVSLNNNVEGYSALKKSFKRSGAHHNQVCPYGVFSGKNDSVVICAPNDRLWGIILDLTGKPELKSDPELSSGAQRCAHRSRVIDIIEGWLKTFDNIQDAVDAMEKAGIPCSKVMTGADLCDDPALVARGMIADFQPPADVTSVTNMKGRGVVVHMSKTPGHIGRPPMLGQHNDEVFQTFGFNMDEIHALQKEWNEKYAK